LDTKKVIANQIPQKAQSYVESSSKITSLV